MTTDNKATPDDLADLTEPFLDEGIKQLADRFAGEALPEIAGEIPVLKTLVAVGKVFNSAKDYHRTRMLLAFLSSLKDGSKSMDDFEALSEEDRAGVRGLVIAQLDMQTDVLQAEAIAFIVDAYLSGEIHWLVFVGVLSEIKNTNPVLYRFNVDAITVDWKESGVAEAAGPTHLLPAAFGHNTITGIGQWDSVGTYLFVLSNLGKDFFKYVYEPMMQKHLA